MAQFTINTPVATTTPLIDVDAGLPPGPHRFQLIAVDEAGNRSQAAIADVVVNPPLFAATASSVPATVRSEGRSELLGDLVLTLTGGAPTSAGSIIPSANITVTLPVAITSLTVSPTPAAAFSDTVLLIDDPQVLNTTLLIGGATITVGTAGTNFRSGSTPNIFLGRVSGNQVTFIGVPIDPPGTGTRTLRITNIRADVSALSSGTAPASAIQASISISGQALPPIANPVLMVAARQSAANFRVDSLVAGAAGNLFTYSRRAGINLNPSAAAVNFTLTFTEGFASAFKVRKQGPAGIGLLLPQQETGFDNVGPGAAPIQAGNPALPPLLGTATNGTRFQAIFGSIPAGARVFVTVQNLTGGVAVAPAKAILISAADTPDANGVVPALSPSLTITGGIGVFEIPVAAGSASASAVWECVNKDPAAAAQIESLVFGVVVSAAAQVPTVPPQPAVTATVRCSLVPVSRIVPNQNSLRPCFTDDSVLFNAFRAT